MAGEKPSYPSYPMYGAAKSMSRGLRAYSDEECSGEACSDDDDEDEAMEDMASMKP